MKLKVVYKGFSSFINYHIYYIYTYIWLSLNLFDFCKALNSYSKYFTNFLTRIMVLNFIRHFVEMHLCLEILIFSSTTGQSYLF